jgi:hypothetical protein
MIKKKTSGGIESWYPTLTILIFLSVEIEFMDNISILFKGY